MVGPGEDSQRRLRVFCSYAHSDYKFQQELKDQLSVLIKAGLLEEVWFDRDIKPGDDWEYVIDESLHKADIIIFLVSHTFINSEYCSHKEYEAALARKDEAWLLPILVREFLHEATVFSAKEMMPKRDGRLVPLESWKPRRSSAYRLVAEEIQKYADRIGLTIDHTAPAADQMATPVNRLVPAADRVQVSKPSGLWNLPVLNLKVFASDDFLTQIHDNLVDPASLPVVITGRAGLGKSTMVNSYARNVRALFDHVFWLGAQDDNTLSQDCTKLALYLGLPTADQKEVRAAIRKWLEEHQSWLVILDNVIDHESVDKFDSFIPERGSGRVIMTSRAGSVWNGIATELPLPRRPVDDCVDMLLAWSGEDDREAAAELCILLNRIPLAIWEAAQKMRKLDLTIDEYTEGWRPQYEARMQKKLELA